MRLFRYALFVVLAVILGAAVYQTMQWLGAWGDGGESQVKSLDGDDQEIALIEPATSIDDWGRLVTAFKLLEADWPRIHPSQPALHLSLENAFPDLTASVPEMVVHMASTPQQRLRLRWYKISGEHDAASWVAKLHARKRPPLAIVGGGTSDRAIRLAYALKAAYPDPAAPAPLFLITTATAERTKTGQSVIGIYKDRSFRFSFTNQKMVHALLKFIRQTPDLWPHEPAAPRELTATIAGMTGAGDAWSAAETLHRHPYLQPYKMHAVSWQDERYSQDMEQLFRREFPMQFPLCKFYDEGSIPFSMGGFFHPSPHEQDAVGTFLANPVAPHSFLVLPTGTVRMRRFLINLRQRSPRDARNLVILNGDAISFHSVYRDRDVMWNILDLPYSLVFFAHRNPIDAAAGFTWTRPHPPEAADAFPQRSTTGTHDILLDRDLLEAVLYAVYDGDRLLADPLRVRERMRATCWHHPPPGTNAAPRVCNPRVHGTESSGQRFFDADGDRQSHTGEHIVWIKPNFTGERVDLTARIGVWALTPEADGGTWRLLQAHAATYNQGRLEDPQP